jgi:hypothetical protein
MHGFEGGTREKAEKTSVAKDKVQHMAVLVVIRKCIAS